MSLPEILLIWSRVYTENINWSAYDDASNLLSNSQRRGFISMSMCTEDFVRPPYRRHTLRQFLVSLRARDPETFTFTPSGVRLELQHVIAFFDLYDKRRPPPRCD